MSAGVKRCPTAVARAEPRLVDSNAAITVTILTDAVVAAARANLMDADLMDADLTDKARSVGIMGVVVDDAGGLRQLGRYRVTRDRQNVARHSHDSSRDSSLQDPDVYDKRRGMWGSFTRRRHHGVGANGSGHHGHERRHPRRVGVTGAAVGRIGMTGQAERALLTCTPLSCGQRSHVIAYTLAPGAEAPQPSRPLTGVMSINGTPRSISLSASRWRCFT